jgi:hypothetical protein
VGPAIRYPISPDQHRKTAEELVTYKVADFAAAARRFGLRVVTPGELLKELKT